MTLKSRLLESIAKVLLISAVFPCAARGETDGPIHFRRYIAPADRLEDWPIGRVKYLPIEPAEFERLLKTAPISAPGPGAFAATRVSAAEYRARMVDDRLLTGRAILQVDHAAEADALLALDPCGLAVGKATWGNGESVEATLGAGVDGKLEVLVERSGQLQFEWSLGGRRDATESVNFQFRLPRCPVNRLLLDLPENLTPLPDRGIVSDAGSVDAGFHRWRIELGGHCCCRLRVVPAEASQQRRQVALVREAVRYDFSLHGVEVSAQLKFEVHNDPLGRVTLELDPQLQLVSARYGDKPVPWSVDSRSENRTTRVELTLPEPIRGTGRVLQLGALAPLVTDRPWRLPRIRPQGVFWQEGNLTMSVPAPLVIEKLTPVGCRQSDTGVLAAPRSGESAQFQFFAADATVQVTLSRQQSLPQLTSGTAIALDENEVAGRVVADFRTAKSSHFLLSADVTPHWLVDSVESLPANAIDDWTLTGGDGRSQELTVRLAKALTPARPVRIIVAARRLRSSLKRNLGLNDLLPLRFRVGADSARLVAVRALEPYRLDLTGTEQLQRIDHRSLDADELELFARPPVDLLFEDTSGAEELQISLEARKPSYTGVIRVEASVGEDKLQESYTLRCVPESARVGRVVAHFSHRRDEPLRWTLGAEDGQQLSARQMALEEQTALGLPPNEETWEITLRRARSVPFEIRGSREIRLLDRQPICLASLPEANSQQATLLVRSLDPNTVRVANNRLVPIVPEAVSPDRYQTTRATYRYDPLRDATATAEAAVTVSLSTAATVPVAWVWNCQLQSHYETDGTGRHLATYRLQSSGAGALELALPPPVRFADVRGVWVDGERAIWDRVAGRATDVLAMELPADEKFPIVSVQFTSQATRLGIAGSLQPPLPRANLPVLSRSWTVWLPPGYEHCDLDPRWHRPGKASPAWSRRLFGRLGREVGQQAFDPFTAANWSRPVSDRSARQSAGSRAEQFLWRLGDLVAGGAEAGVFDWAGVFGHESMDPWRQNLLVDRYALRQLGLVPQTPLRPVSEDNRSARGAALLEKANLALLVHADIFLLTSQTNVALLADHLRPLGRQNLWWVLPGPLAEQMQRAAAGGTDRALVPVETWRRQPPEPKTLWQQPGPDDGGAANAYGWKACRMTISGQQPVRLRFVHSQSIRLLGSVTFLLVIALGCWKARNRPVLLTCLAGVFATAAVVLPAACVPVASGAVLGTLFCLALRLICRREADSGASGWQWRPQLPGTVSAATQLGILVLAVATLVSVCAVASGQQPAVDPPEAPPTVYRVFIPSDDQGRPTGEKYYVPEELWKELHRRAAATTERPQGWLIGSATYRGVLSRETASERLKVDELKAIFDLHALSPGARVRVPFRRDWANLLPEGTLLDGRAIQPEWEPGGNALLLTLPSSDQGQYRLELSLRPTLRSDGARTGFDLATPRLATSQLKLILPEGAPAIEVPSATGAIVRTDQPPGMEAKLGPGERLTVRWPIGTTATGTGVAVDVEELLWLHVRPGSVVIRAKFKLKSIEGRFRQLRLATDPRLRLLPLKRDDAPTAEVQLVLDEPQIVRLEWPRPITGDTEVEATFLVTGTSGVGNLRMPQLESLDGRTTRRWMAVSVDPALEYEEDADEGPEAVAVPDFLSSWGKSDQQPKFAYRLPSGAPDWSMSTRPGEPRTTVEQTLKLSFEEGSAEVRFDAQLVTTAGYKFQHQLSGPAELRIESLSVLQDGVQHVNRFSQNQQGVITVFLKGPVTGRQEFSMRGRLPVTIPRNMPLPVLQFDQSTLKSSTVQLFRQPSVLVRVSQAVGLDEVENLLVEGDEAALGRLVHWFRARVDRPIKAMLSLAPNHPEIRAEQVVWLLHRGRSWEAKADFHIHAIDGVVDQLQIDFPRPLDGPYRVDPAATVKVVGAAGAERQLIVRPREAIAAGYRCSVSSPLALVPGGRISAPQIKLKKVDQLRRFLVLPKRAEGRSITWETRGLREVDLPEDYSRPVDAEEFAVYEMAGEPCQAVLKRPQRVRSNPRVRLTDIRVDWQADESCRGLATFDLEPSMAVECPLWLPRGYRLVQVVVAGVPTAPLPVGENAWRLPLGPRRLPQRIEVLFTARFPENSSATRRRFEAPALGDQPVARTLWSVSGPPSYGAGQPDQGGSIAPWRLELERFKSIADLTQLAASVADESAEQTPRWYRLWARRLLAARRALERQLLLAGPTRQVMVARSEVSTIDREQAQLARRLGTVNVLTQLSAATPRAEDPAQLWLRSLDYRRVVSRCTSGQDTTAITLSYDPTRGNTLLSRLPAAAGVAAMLLLLVFALRRRMLDGLLRKWPHAVGVGIGLAWWLWLSPSVVGWGIVALSLIASLRSGWKRVVPEQPSSIISVRSVTR